MSFGKFDYMGKSFAVSNGVTFGDTIGDGDIWSLK
jgi:hypothetical protein